jgi:hypothetical protein
VLRIANRLRATDSDEVDGSIRHGHRFTAGERGGSGVASRADRTLIASALRWAPPRGGASRRNPVFLPQRGRLARQEASRERSV